MAKDSSIRLILALLLAVQILCWALTLLDLLSPGKPLALARSTTQVVSQVASQILSHRLPSPSAVLSFKDILIRI
jgi:hypothetical protein